MSDTYVRIIVKVEAKTTKAVMLSHGDGVSRGTWIPRSCLHAASDLALVNIPVGEEVELQIREWIAEREGFL